MAPPASEFIEFAPPLIGWLLGWMLLWRLRPLPDARSSSASSPSARPAVAVIVPARNEAEALPRLLPPLLAGAREHDEILVVDDHSSDATAEVARTLGARVITPPALPEGWLGKPHACWIGAAHTTAPVLAFIDADVEPPEDLIDRLADAVAAHPEAVTSVQPWHHVERPSEQLSMFCNIAALMGAGRFAIWPLRATNAFGPVLALKRSAYVAADGHRSVRTMHTEDIGLARQIGRSEVYSGRPDVAFRMYPGGIGAVIAGWTRSLATGALSVRWWLAIAIGLWIWTLSAGWMVGWWMYPLCALQVGVLARRAGSFSAVMAALYPLALLVFVVVLARSMVAVAFKRQVSWKQRRVDAR